MTLTLSVRSFQVPATPGTVGLSAEPSVGADLAGDARDFGGERVELVDHRVDRVLQLENLAAGIDGDLAREVAAGDRRGDLGDVADLRRQVCREQVDVVGEVLPGAADAGHDRLSAELALGADLARDARDFGREGSQLLDHRVEGVLEQQQLAADVNGDLLRQVALRHGGGDLGDVTDLRREVAGHEVDVVGEVLPRAGDAGDLCLTAELAFGADLAGDARDLRGKRVELVDHAR